MYVSLSHDFIILDYSSEKDHTQSRSETSPVLISMT